MTTEPYYDNGVLERLPDIEADRAKNPDSWDGVLPRPTGPTTSLRSC